MALIQFSDDVRNAVANAVESTIGASPTLEIRTGAKPTTPASADTGTLLVSIPVPPDWLTGASVGIKVLQGTWSASAVASGDQGHFRLKQAGATKAQGAISLAGGGGAMIANNLTLASGQNVSVSAFTLTAGNS